MFLRLSAIAVVFLMAGDSLGAVLLPDDPTLAPNLKLWLAADAVGVPDGTAVPTWTDSSANGNNAVSLAGKTDPVKESIVIPKVGGANVIDFLRFDGASDELMRADALFGGSGSGDFSIITVYGTSQISGDNRPVGLGAYRDGDTANNYNLATDPSIRKDNGNIPPSQYSAAHPTDYFIRSSVMTTAAGGSVQEFFDGTQVLNSGANYTTGTDDFFLGDLRRAPGGSFNYNFDIAEVIVYDKALSATERQGLEEYLTERYFAVSGSPGIVTASTTAPTEDILQSHEVTGGTSRLRINNGTAGQTQNSGQTFQHDSRFLIEAVTFKIDQNSGEGTFSGGNDLLELRIFRVDDGRLVYGEVFDADINPAGQDFAQDDYVTFAFGTPTPVLDPNTEYGALLTWLGADSDHIFRIQRSTNDQYPLGGHLFLTGLSGSPGGYDATFFIQGRAVPEPSSLALLAVGGLALLFRRRGRKALPGRR